MTPPSPKSGGLVHTVLETVAIAEVGREDGKIKEECFAPEELAGLSQRRLQSLAGSLAVKRALQTLYGLLTLPAPPAKTERSFILSREIHQPPRILAGFNLAGGRVWISIAHTRSHAYGLAVWQEEQKA